MKKAYLYDSFWLQMRNRRRRKDGVCSLNERWEVWRKELEIPALKYTVPLHLLAEYFIGIVEFFLQRNDEVKD